MRRCRPPPRAMSYESLVARAIAPLATKAVAGDFFLFLFGEESGLLLAGSTRGPKVYGWYSFVLKGIGVFP